MLLGYASICIWVRAWVAQLINKWESRSKCCCYVGIYLPLVTLYIYCKRHGKPACMEIDTMLSGYKWIMWVERQGWGGVTAKPIPLNNLQSFLCQYFSCLCLYYPNHTFLGEFLLIRWSISDSNYLSKSPYWCGRAHQCEWIYLLCSDQYILLLYAADQEPLHWPWSLSFRKNSILPLSLIDNCYTPKYIHLISELVCQDATLLWTKYICI